MFVGWLQQHGGKVAHYIVVPFLVFIVYAFCATLFMLFTAFFFGWPAHAEHFFR